MRYCFSGFGERKENFVTTKEEEEEKQDRGLKFLSSPSLSSHQAIS
jgi:hypothetical protein